MAPPANDGVVPYLPEEEQAADALAVALLNEIEASGCRVPTVLPEDRPRTSDEGAWAPWLHEHPVSAERTEALAELCPGTARP